MIPPGDSGEQGKPDDRDGPSDARRESVDAEQPYEQVRHTLIERGYLHGPIERFVLDDLLHAPGPVRMARTAAKAAIIGGTLLGVLLAAAAAAAHRPLLRAADLPLLWFYFTLVSVVALFVLDLGAAAAVAALARRRGARSTDALRASAIVGVPTLVYLSVLWLSHRPGASLLADALFLAAAVAATLLVAWLAGLVSLVDVIGSTGQIPDRVRRPVLVVLLALAAIGVGLGAMHVGSTNDAVSAAPFETRPVSTPLLFVGIDGLDSNLLEQVGEDRVPHLTAFARRAASYALERDEGAEPAEVWTTILTGTPVDVHRVRSAESQRLPGVATPLQAVGADPLGAALRFVLPTRTVPASGVGRTVRNLPEILGLRRATASVGWWASWPAVVPESGGFVVSDRVLPKLLSGAPADRDTAPGSLYHRLGRDFEGSRPALRSAFEAGMGRWAEDADDDAGRLVWESYLIDAWAWSVATRLAESEVSGTFVYLPGLDILRHRLHADASLDGATVPAVTDYVEWLDGLLGQASGALENSLVLVADRGRHGSGSGFVLLVDPSAPPGCVGGAVAPTDVAPTVLGLRGFPGSRELPGVRPESCLEGVAGVGAIAGYGRRPVYRGASASPFDAEMVERLRSLGYLN